MTMMKKLNKIAAMPLLIIGSFTLAAGAAMTLPALAKPPELSKQERKRQEQQVIRDAVARGEIMPLPRILAIAEKKVPGDVLKVELEQEPWGIKYEVKIITSSGRIREVELNARTGAFIRIEDD